MSRSDDRKEPMQRALFDRMDGKAQEERSDMFRQMTQGRGKQQIFGTGKPENVPKPPKRKAKP